MHIVNKYEAVDINTEEHLLIAECIGNIIYNKYIKKDINYEKIYKLYNYFMYFNKYNCFCTIRNNKRNKW